MKTLNQTFNQMKLPASARPRGDTFVLQSFAVAPKRTVTGMTSRTISCLALSLTVALLGTSCKTYSSRVVTDPAPAVERLRHGGTMEAEVDLLVKPVMQRGEADGMAVGVLSPAGFQVFGYGTTGEGTTQQVPRADTIFEVGSVAKLFVAAVLAELVEQGQVRYEDTVRDILPPSVGVSKDVGELTLYELVTHTGGLPRQPATFGQMMYFFQYLFTGKNLYAYIDKDFLYSYIRTCHIKPRGMRKYEYSNIGAGLLAHLLELRTGKTMAQLVAETITKPLGMKDTVYQLNDEQKKRLAMGHAGGQPRFMRRHTPLPPWDMGEIMHPTAGLYSTVNDLMIFARANLGLTQLPLDELFRTIQQVQIRRPEEDVAFGWILNYFDFPGTKSTIIYKHGMVAGYHAYIGIEKQRKVAVVVLCNTFSWSDKIGHNLVLRAAGAAVPETRISKTEVQPNSQ